MDCPLCDQRSKVIESRAVEGGDAVRRRRECGACGHRFTTFERSAPAIAVVRKRDGRREEFQPEKLRAGLERAAHKLPAAEAAIGRIAETVELEAAAGGELSTRRIGELCLEGLQAADEVACLRFALVHKQLADTEAIRIELSALDLADAAALARGELPRESANPDDFHPKTEQAETGDPPDLGNENPGRKLHA